MPILSPETRMVNSLSYSDVAGLYMGFDRLPGEDTQSYLDRLYKAAYARKDHSFRGAVNQISLHLGLQIRPGITISSSHSDASVSCGLDGLRLISVLASIDTTIPLFTIESDFVLTWYLLSSIVASVNTVSGFTASLLIEDGPALQLVKQSSFGIMVAEPIGGIRTQLKESGIIIGTELFNAPVPSYTLDTSGLLVFTSAPASGSAVTYQFNMMPFSLTCSEAGIIGLTESGIPNSAVKDGVLAYQIREAIQDIMSEDRSYWTR